MAHLRCPLSDPSLGIITENDHKVGACLCSLCTCGKHQCPTRPYSHSSHVNYHTSYERSYKSFKAKPVKRYTPFIPFVGSSAKLEGKTSMKRDYQPPTTLNVRTVEPPRSISPSFSFVSSTSYRQDYPNWGPTHPLHLKRPTLPIRPTELRFTAQSSYKQAYDSSESLLRNSGTDTLTPVKRCQSVIGLGSLSFTEESTAKRAYKGIAGIKDMNPRVKVKAEELMILETPACHHITTSLAAFQPILMGGRDWTVHRRKKMARLRERDGQ